MTFFGCCLIVPETGLDAKIHFCFVVEEFRGHADSGIDVQEGDLQSQLLGDSLQQKGANLYLESSCKALGISTKKLTML